VIDIKFLKAIIAPDIYVPDSCIAYAAGVYVMSPMMYARYSKFKKYELIKELLC